MLPDKNVFLHQRMLGPLDIRANFLVRKSVFHLLLIFIGFVWFLGTTPTAMATGISIRVACIGDSITYGAHLKNRQHQSYPAVLAQMLGPGFDVQNFGVGGATLLKMGDEPYFKQSAYTNALAFKPNIVVILLGTNDSKHRGPGSLNSNQSINNWQYKADFVPDYKDLINRFHEANPKARIFVCLPTPCFPGSWGINGNTIQTEIIPLIREVASQTKTNLIDLNSAFTDKATLFPDTVHPNAKGAELIAFIVCHALTGKM